MTRCKSPTVAFDQKDLWIVLCMAANRHTPKWRLADQLSEEMEMDLSEKRLQELIETPPGRQIYDCLQEPYGQCASLMMDLRSLLDVVYEQSPDFSRPVTLDPYYVCKFLVLRR